MRVRQYPAIGFGVLLLVSAYLGLSTTKIPSISHSDKGLHFITFFLLTLCFYWIIETNRRRVLHITFFVCPVVLGIGSEIAQGLLPNGREFDPYDIAANILGSGAALGVCSWYHRRMLERKRQAKYDAVPGEDEDRDIELGEGTGPQESGVTGESRAQTLEEEVDNWDENAEDWDEDGPTPASSSQKTPGSSMDDDEPKKRVD